MKIKEFSHSNNDVVQQSIKEIQDCRTELQQTRREGFITIDYFLKNGDEEILRSYRESSTIIGICSKMQCILVKISSLPSPKFSRLFEISNLSLSSQSPGPPVFESEV